MRPGLWLLIALSGAGCDAGPVRESTTVRRDHAPVRPGIDTIDAGETIDADDGSGATSIDVNDGGGEPDELTEPETVADTVAETVTDTVVETVAETTAETVAETVTDTVTDTVAETVAETVTETVAETVTEVDGGPVEGEPCQVGSLVGSCQYIADCGPDEIAAEGFCEGGPQIRCCLAAEVALERCSANRAPGACMATAGCTAPDWKSTSGLCPGAADIRCCTSTTAPPLCDPALRPTPNDGFVEEPGDPGCAPGMGYVAASEPFCMDRFEASLVLASDPSVSLSPYHNPGTTGVRAVSLRYGVPQGYIDEVRAKAACQSAGKRLCSTTEWLFACQGDAGWTYPYGTVREPGRCNDDRRQHVAVEYFGTSESWIYSEIDNACLAQLPASLDLAGENEGCQTPAGIYDLMGNLHEWVDDDAGTFRGGFFDDTVINGQGCLYRTTAHGVGHWDYSTGFRCCAEPAP